MTTRPIGIAMPGAAFRFRRIAALAAAGLALVAASALSLALGARGIAAGEVLDAVLRPEAGNNDHIVVRELRLPRTLIGIAAGSAFGVAGALIQSVTRNPIADPGLLGLNAGAALAVVTAISVFGTSSPGQQVWFAFAGTAAAAAVVAGVASAGRAGATPARVALAGAAVAAAATSITTLLLLSNLETLDRFRFWQVGSPAGRDLDALAVLLPALIAGFTIAAAAGRMLNAMVLGDDLARSLGARVGVARVACAVGVVLLCGAGTALSGPIAFIGLMTPHLARRLCGTDHRWTLAASALLGAALLVTADVAGRLLAPPGEVEAGLVVAVIGAPVMVAVVRRSMVSAP